MLFTLPPDIEATPTIQSVYVSNAADLTCGGGAQDDIVWTGEPVTGDGFALTRQTHADLTGALPRAARTDAVPSMTPVPPRHLRLQLLAKKYARGGLGSEEAARLEILSERLRATVRRVTDEDIRALGEADEFLEDTEDFLKQLRLKHGI